MRFAYSRPDGGVRIVIAAPKEDLAPLLVKYGQDLAPLPFTDADYRAHVFERNGVTEADVVMLPDDWTPPDGPRDSWIISGGQVVADPAKAAALRVPKIKEEAQRRIVVLTGASDIVGCLIKQHNAQMRATELTLIQAQGGTWTAEQAAEAAALQSLALQIKAIRAASNVLEPNPPQDYTDDKYWP